MNLKYCVVVLVCFLIHIKSYSQEVYIGFHTGIGSYAMSDLKQVNDDLLKSLPFDARITDDFPVYLNYKIFLKSYYENKYEIGLKLSYLTTASRISRSDYSGNFTFDNIVYCWSPGITFDIMLFALSQFRISLYNETGFEFSIIELKNKLRTSNQTDKQSEIYKSNNIYSELGFEATYGIKKFVISMNFGFSVDIVQGGVSQNPSLYDFSRNGNPLITWTGCRLGFGVAYKIN